MASWKNRDRVIARLTRLPPALRQAQQETLEEETPLLVAAFKRACPVAEDLERTPGELEESIHAYDGHRALPSGGVRTTMLKTVVADATDAKGNYIGPHVEYGHMGKDGGRVPAHPWWWPTWRAQRGGLRRRMAAKGRAACKAIAGDIARG